MDSKDFTQLNLEEHSYKVNTQKLPIDSYIQYGGFTYANFTPYIIHGDDGFGEHKQLNWTNKLLWNKLGKLNIKDTQILMQNNISEEQHNELISLEAQKIARENLADRINYLQNINTSIDFKLWKMNKENLERQELLLRQINELKEEIKSLKNIPSTVAIIPTNTYTINMIRTETEDWKYFKYIEKELVQNKTEAIAKILDNSYIINDNLGLLYERYEEINPTPKPYKRPETIFDTPQYAKYIRNQKRQEEYEKQQELKKENENKEYQEFLEWKEKQQKDKGKGIQTVYPTLIIPDIKPEKQKKEDMMLEMIKNLQNELEQLKIQRHKEHEKQAELTKIQMLEEELEEELDPDNLEKEVLNNIQNIQISSDISESSEINEISDNETEQISGSDSDYNNEQINVKIEGEEYEYKDNYRYYKPQPPYYKKDIRRERQYKGQSSQRADYIKNRREEFESTYQANMNTTINDSGEILNLDCTTPEEAEDRIQKWTQSMSIALVKQQLSNEQAKQFIRRTFIGNVKEWYKNLTNEAKQKLEGNAPLLSLTHMELGLRAEFGKLGIESDVEKHEKKTSIARHKILQLQICSMDHQNLNAYLCEFQEYYYSANYTEAESENILNMFYSKLPEPWGQQVLNGYLSEIKGKNLLDSIGARMTYLQEFISDKCKENWTQKQARKIQLSKNLDCSYYEVGKYGCKQIRPHKRKRYYKKYIPIKRKYFNKKRYKKYYRPKKFLKRKNPHKACKCYNCGEEGHISPNCKKPKKKTRINNLEALEFKNTEMENLEFETNKNDIIWVEEIEVIQPLHYEEEEKYKGNYSDRILQNPYYINSISIEELDNLDWEFEYQEDIEDDLEYQNFVYQESNDNWYSDQENWYSDEQYLGIYMFIGETSGENNQDNMEGIIKEYNKTEPEKINKIIFTSEKFKQIMENDLNMTKDKIFHNNKLKKLFGKKEIEYYIVTDIEHPIDVKYVQNQDKIINLPLYNQEIFENEIQKIPDKDQNKIRNIHLAAVEIVVKAYFREGIDTPFEIILCDDRITYPQEGSLVEVLIGNLIYQKVKFTKIINYSISIEDKNLDKSLVMYWNLEGIKMIKDSKIFSIRLRNLYVLSNKHIVKNKKQYNGNIIIEPIFQDVIQNNNRNYIEYGKPGKFDRTKLKSYSRRFNEPLRLDDRTNIQREKDQIEKADHNLELQKELNNLNYYSQQGQSSNVLDIPKILKIENTKNNYKQFHIIGKITEGRLNKFYPILIDTGAAHSYISSKILEDEKLVSNKLSKVVTSYNADNEKHIYDRNTEVIIELIDKNNEKYKINFIGLVDQLRLLEGGKAEILLGMNILQNLKPYCITDDYLEINLGFRCIKINRIKKDIFEIREDLQQMNVLNE
uniref:ORF I n=1 Tax=Cassava vein mosaic virus TaxID=38062 RepID=Q66275_CSVMV|nr:ORF I [Cassava vein mosaic virus]